MTEAETATVSDEATLDMSLSDEALSDLLEDAGYTPTGEEPDGEAMEDSGEMMDDGSSMTSQDEEEMHESGDAPDEMEEVTN